MFKNPILFH